jgi:putative acetyltransferase
MENIQVDIRTESGLFRIRPIRESDSEAIRDIILETLVEHGATGGGFASSDRDTQEMFVAFQRPGRKYFIVENSVGADPWSAHLLGGPWVRPNGIYGGAGFAPLPGEPGTCELVKMYFRQELRGLGIGKRLLQLCMDEAIKAGYRRMYLETIECMRAARGLYEHLGFTQIGGPMGNTGHFSCDVFYLKDLVPSDNR